MDIELEIDGRQVRTNAGATIMEVAAGLGVYIPHFCYHPKLSIAANCRMCLVEVEKSPKPLPACATAALDGMVIHTDSAKAKEAQNSVMEFLLINHPLDCPICDQGGECQLQDLAVGYGMSKSRYNEEKRVVFEKNLGPLISTDMTRCIHCTRCVRFGREIGGIMELGMTGRGEHAEIMPFVERTVDSELSGNMIDVCPVGALTSKPFRFSARPWELTKKSGLSMHDAWGSNLILQTKGASIKRVTPRDNNAINECWISDRDRFSYLGLSAPDRMQTPLFRMHDGRQFSEVAWTEALSITVRRLKKCIGAHGAAQVAFLISPAATAEELFLWQKLARGLGCDNIDSRLRQRDFSPPTEVSPQFGFSIAAVKKARAVLFVGAEPAREQPLLATHMRKTRMRRMSIGAVDIGKQLSLSAQQLSRPSDIANWLMELNQLLGLSKKNATASLFESREPPQALKDMATWLKDAKGDKHILLGDAVCNAPDFGAVLQAATILGAGTGASVGILSPAANSAGARQNGVFPQQNGMSAAAMLHAKPKAVMLFNCEPKDFADTASADSMLADADFVGVLTAFNGGIEKHADVILPTAIFGENEGTMINGEGVAQTFTAAVTPPGKSRPGWKILRVLGELLNIAGFDFSSLDEVRQMMKESAAAADKTMAESATESTIKSATTQSATSENATAKSTPTAKQKSKNTPPEVFEIVGGTAIYDTDMLVRRAPALQATQQGKKAAFAFFHPEDMTACNLAEGGAVRLGDGDGNIWDTHAFADERLARGVILAYPPNLNLTDIAIEALPEQKAAN